MVNQNLISNITLDPNAKVPEYKTEYSAGADLSCCIDVTIEPMDIALVDTGVSIELPRNTVGLLCLRSSLANNMGLIMANGVGIIDADYRGTIKVCLFNTNKHPVSLSIGTRIAQIIITPIITAEFQQQLVLSETRRGVGGFGSTGV